LSNLILPLFKRAAPDSILAQQAQMAVANSQMVGSEIFIAELERLAALDD
jgi:hypothetical protein